MTQRMEARPSTNASRPSSTKRLNGPGTTLRRGRQSFRRTPLRATVPEVGNLVRLRISLADRPGALAQVATIIAGHGGNITSVDVQRVDVEFALDDIVVEFSGEPDLAELRDDLATNASATVMSYQEAHVDDPIVGSLRWLVELLDSGPGDPAVSLAEGVAALCSSPVVWVSTAEAAVSYDAGRFALEHNAAIALQTTELPEHLAERLPGEVCLLAVPDSERLTGGRVVFVARPVANDFTATEIVRIEALIALYSRIERLVAPSEQ
jgi:predicted amino acid-binding ACT domain protein